jgi:hypothetical protein
MAYLVMVVASAWHTHGTGGAIESRVVSTASHKDFHEPGVDNCAICVFISHGHQDITTNQFFGEFHPGKTLQTDCFLLLVSVPEPLRFPRAPPAVVS